MANKFLIMQNNEHNRSDHLSNWCWHLKRLAFLGLLEFAFEFPFKKKCNLRFRWENWNDIRRKLFSNSSDYKYLFWARFFWIELRVALYQTRNYLPKYSFSKGIVPSNYVKHYCYPCFVNKICNYGFQEKFLRTFVEI